MLFENAGRDHNTFGYTWWFAGGGFKGGTMYGATDEFGHHAVENKVSHHDFHATLMHLFGLDAKKLAYAKPDALVMHPGPMNRGVEISDEVADSAVSLVTRQVRAGLVVRMAVLYDLLAGGEAAA